MTDVTLTRSRIQAGVWEGILQAEGEAQYFPELDVSHHDDAIDGLILQQAGEDPNTWSVRFPIPVERLSDGVQTFVISDRKTGDRLESFTVISGEPLDDDIRAEIALLRAELDLLKRAFRRHCVETAG